MKPTTEIKYLTLEATKQLGAEGHERWILKCYKKNRAITEQAKALALEIPREKVKNSYGALFTFWFKKLMGQR